VSTTRNECRPAQAPWPGDHAAERLRDAVLAPCATRADFPGKVEAALRVTLRLLAADPELAHLLTAQPYVGGDEQALRAQQHWQSRFGDMLRDAAAGHPAPASRPRFLEPFLIGGVRFQIGRQVLAGEAAQLERLLPDLLEPLLAFYLGPEEAGRIARAAEGS
jgi:hypothetical protein